MTDCTNNDLSIILPARNEAESLSELLPKLVENFPSAEIIVVNDGSTDGTEQMAKAHGVIVISHPYPLGNGAAIKTGARVAQGKYLVCMDADGQHKPEDILILLARLQDGYDMAVGARVPGSQANTQRAVANDVFSRFATWMVNQKVEDLTSGFRIVDAKKFRQFLYLLPNGFSYPTTITMSFFRSGYSVAYVPIHTPKRIGTSHLRPFRDGVRFLLIILKVGTLYSPQKLFLPISAGFFCIGFAYYLFTYFTMGRLTNMSALMFISSILTFLIGIVSEQVSALHYKDTDRDIGSDNSRKSD